MAHRAGVRAPGDPGAGGRRGALDRDRGRGPLPRRPRRRPAGRRARGVHRAGGRSAGRPHRPLRPHPRAVPGGRGGPPLRARRRRGRRGGRPAGVLRAGSCAASCVPRARRRCPACPPTCPRPARTSATPRCCAGCGAARWPGCAPRSSPSSPRRWAASCRRGTGSGPSGCAARPAPTTSWASSSSSRARRSRPARSRASCSRLACPATPPRCSTSSPAPGRSPGPAAARWPAATAGWRSRPPTSPTCCCPTPRTSTSTPRCTARCARRSTRAARCSSASSPSAPRPCCARAARPRRRCPTTPRSSPRCGTSCGRGSPPTTRSRRSGRSCPAAGRAAAGARGAGRTGSAARPRAAATPGSGARPCPRAPARRRPRAAGRACPSRETEPTRRAQARTEAFLERHGVLTRGALDTERVTGGFAGIYPVLRAMEESGRARRGYVIEGLGAAQFAVPGAIDRLRAESRLEDDGGAPSALVLAATDPAQPWGAALELPPTIGDNSHRAGAQGGRPRRARRRRAGDLRRAGRQVAAELHHSSATPSPPAASALATAVHEGWLGGIAVEKADGSGALDGDPRRGAHRRRLPAQPEGPAPAGLRAGPRRARAGTAGGRRHEHRERSAMALACPTCEQSAAEYLGMADDGRNMMRCTSCGHEWVLGAKPVSPRAISQTTRSRSTTTRSTTTRSATARTTSPARPPPARPRREPGRRSRAARGPARSARPVEGVDIARRRFPTADDVAPGALARLESLRKEFLADFPRPDPEAGLYRDVYRQAFEADALPVHHAGRAQGLRQQQGRRPARQHEPLQRRVEGPRQPAGGRGVPRRDRVPAARRGAGAPRRTGSRR